MNGHSDILIIGGGIGGMTAALYAARANLSVRIVEKEVCGGLVNWTHTVENVPSYKSIHGMDLMTACREHVESLGVAIEEVNEVEEVRLDGQPKEIRTSEGDRFTADVVIIATGRKPIPLPVETAFEKVHYCSVCDGTAYKDKDVLVVGGGNSGFDESLYLAGLGVRSVHIVEMFPACAAAQSTQDRALATGIIRANVNTTITALDPLPDGRCRASLRDAASGAASEETVDGVFCFIGQKPNTALLEGLIDMEKGYIRTDEDMRTSLPGVFAVGDVRAKRYRQITTAMGDGTVAALEAERFIRSLRWADWCSAPRPGKGSPPLHSAKGQLPIDPALKRAKSPFPAVPKNLRPSPFSSERTPCVPPPHQSKVLGEVGSGGGEPFFRKVLLPRLSALAQSFS